jgi:DNA-binding GntR family transcriptional regulator
MDRRTVTDSVYEHMRERLAFGRLAPGERLSLREIGGGLGVSVMPVREAVNRLVAERALEITPGRILRVPLSSPEQVRDLADIRATVEGFAAERAALMRTEAQLKAMEAAEATLRTMVIGNAEDHVAWIAMNQTLHFNIYKGAHLPLLMKMIADLWLRAGPALNVNPHCGSQRLTNGSAVRCHAEAVRAIRMRDGMAARAAIVEDIQTTAACIIARGDPVAL